MKYSELEGTSMYLYLTLTDIPLFTQTEAQGKVLLDEINRRETDEVVKKALELVTRGELEPDQLMTYALDHLGENYDKKFEEVMSENEDIVDVNKYLLIGAYRNLRLLELLNDPENFEIFPPLEKFRGFKRVYAETAVRIADILKDTDVRVDYDVNEEGHEYGIWNDVTREFESIHFSVEDLMRNIIENPLVKEALESELDTKALENRELSGGIVYDLESDDPFRVSGSSNVERLLSIKALNNQFLRVKRNSEEKKYKNPGQMTIKEFQEHVESTEEDRIRILEKAIGRNGVTILDNKIFMVNDSKEFQMPKSDYELLKTSIRREAKNVERDSRVKNFTADDIVNLCTLLDVAFSVPDFSKDDEIFGLATKILDNLRQRADKDKDFEKLLREYMENYTIVLEDRLNLENAALNTSLYAMKKFGEDEAIHRKYKEMEESNKSKIILLYTRGLLPFEFMKEAGYLNSYYSNSEIMDYYKDGLINKEQTREFMYLSNNNDPQVSESDYIKGLYASAREIKDKKLRDSISRKYFDLLDGKETLQLFAEGYIYTRELYKKNLTVDDVLRCKKEVILSIINTNDKELPKSIVPTEEQIIDLYGKKFSGKDLIDIANNGKLSDEKILQVYSTKKDIDELKFSPDMAFKEDDVLEFYSVDRLLKMISEGKVNKRFVENFNEDLIGRLPKEKQEEYYSNLVDRIKERDKESKLKTNYLYTLVELSEIGLIPAEIAKKEFNPDLLEEMYFAERITERDVVSFYNGELIQNDSLNKILTNQEIEEEVKNKKLIPRGLSAITDNRDEAVRRLFDSEHISVKDIMELYQLKEDSLDADELDRIFKDKNLEELHIMDYITDDITEEKIEGLAKNLLISQDELSNLAARGLVSKEKQRELDEFLNSAAKFEELFGQERKIAVLTETTEGESRDRGPAIHPGNPRNKQLKIDPDLQRKFIKLLGADPRELYLSGLDNTLNGYTVYGFKEYGLMVFAKFDEPNNSTYVTTIGQGSYFLNVMERTWERRDESITIESDATKSALRETEHVKPKNACAGWGKRMLDAMKQLSPKLAERLNRDDKYKKKVQDLIDEISVDYELRK